MKKILTILLLISSTLALDIQVNGTYCGEQIVYGILENEFQSQVTVNETQSKVYIGGVDFCFAPEKELLDAQGFIKLFATVGTPLEPDTYVQTDIVTSTETVIEEFNVNFTECTCNIQFPSGINVEYFPPSSEINPGKIKITGSFLQCESTPKLIAVLTSDEECLEVGDIIAINPFSYISSRTYTPSQAKKIKAKVYAWDPLKDNYGYATKSRVDFPAFSVTAEQGPPAEQGGFTWVSVKITNTGTLSDQYTISIDAPEDWSTGEIITRTLLPDESVISNITVEPPLDFKGSEKVEVIVTPNSLADPIRVMTTVETEKIIDIKPRVDVPPLIGVGENFTIDVVLTSTSTHPSNLYYYVFTEPAAKIEPLVGKIHLDADEQKRIELYGKILESCGADPEHTQVSGLLEDVRSLGNLLKAEVVKAEPDQEVLNTVKQEFNQILIQLVPTKAYEQISRLQGQIQRLLEDYRTGEDPTNSRENLAFTLEGLDDKLDIAQDDVLSDCTPSEQFKIKLVLTRIPDLERFYGEDSATVSIEDVFRVEYPKRELRMQAGKSGSFDIIIYNVGETRRSFDIAARGLTESWVSGTKSFSLDPGYSRTVTLTVRPPRLLSGEFELDLIINSPPYSINRLIPVVIGKYGVKITEPSIGVMEPSKETTVEFVISNLGEVEDNYKIDIEGENWVKYEKNVTIQGKDDYPLNVTFTPPSTATGTYYFELGVESSEYREISDSIKVKVEVSSEESELDEEMTNLRVELNALYEQYGDSQEINQIYSVLNQAQTDLRSGRTDQAKQRLQQVNELINDFKANPPQESPTFLYALVIIIPICGYVIATIYSKKKQRKGGYTPLTELGSYQPIRRAPPPIKYRRPY